MAMGIDAFVSTWSRLYFSESGDIVFRLHGLNNLFASDNPLTTNLQSAESGDVISSDPIAKQLVSTCIGVAFKVEAGYAASVSFFRKTAYLTAYLTSYAEGLQLSATCKPGPGLLLMAIACWASALVAKKLTMHKIVIDFMIVLMLLILLCELLIYSI